MLPASNRGPGQALGFPDVCLTPAAPSPVPAPYPNIAMNAQAAPFSPTVKVNMMNALNLTSSIPMTSGDEAGSAHPLFKQAQRYTLGSFNVFIDGMPGIHLGSLTTHNNMNCPVGAVIVPSAVNVSYSLNGESSTAAVDPRRSRGLSQEELLALGLATSQPSIKASESKAGVLVLRVGVIGEAVAQEVLSSLRDAAPCSALELDLSESPGGCLEAAVELVGLFVPARTPVVDVHDQDGDVLTLRTMEAGEYLDLPITVRVGPRTASAAEVVAGALLQQRRCAFAGERSFGKGVTHQLVVDQQGTITLLRTGEIRLAGGRIIDGQGIDAELSNPRAREPRA